MREPGLRQIAPSKSNSGHSAKPGSPGRANVSVSRVKAVDGCRVDMRGSQHSHLRSATVRVPSASMDRNTAF